MTLKKEFEAMLLEALDEVLESILGESGKEVVYYHLQNSYGIRREDVPEKPEVFAECLNRIFGFGAKIIEDAIIKSLCSRLKTGCEGIKNAKFADFLKVLKEMAKKEQQNRNQLFSFNQP